MSFLGYVALLLAGLAGFAFWPAFRGKPSLEPTDTILDVPCECKRRSVPRSNVVTSRVAIACDERFEFTLRRERASDRFAKALHIVREFQTRDERFDEAVYIGADERGIDEWLEHDAKSREMFVELLAMEPEEDTQVTSIAASGGALTLSAVTKPDMFDSAPDDIATTVATAVMPDLKSIAERLQSFAASEVDPTAFADPYAARARALISLAAGLFVVPGLLLILFALQTPRIELATNPFTDTVLFAAIGTVMCILAAVGAALMWGSARLHTVVASLLLAGGFGALFAVPGLVRQINTEWDQSRAQRYATHIISRYVTHGRRSGTYYHFWLSDWHGKEDHQEVKVDSATYDEFQEGDAVVVAEREGYLGKRWLSDLSRTESDDQWSRP